MILTQAIEKEVIMTKQRETASILQTIRANLRMPDKRSDADA